MQKGLIQDEQMERWISPALTKHSVGLNGLCRAIGCKCRREGAEKV